MCVCGNVGMAALILNSAPDGGEWWYSRFSLFTTGKFAPIHTRWATEAVLTLRRRQIWYAYFLIPYLLSVCLSAFLLCLFCLMFYISFPPIFPAFVSFYLIFSFFIFSYFLFSHIFCPNSFLLLFLSFHDNQGCLVYISWLELSRTT